MGAIAIFLASLLLRLWRLDRPDTLVFDEIYFAKYGFNYLTQQTLFDVHPPLGKYFLALGIWLHGWIVGGLFGGEGFRNVSDVSQLSPIAYRWLNAVVGSLIPLLVGAIAFQLTRRVRYTLLSAGFVALDGLLLVESRLSLINVYLLAFGLLGLWCFLRGVVRRDWNWLTLAGASWGACASVKWNGLGFLLGAYLLYGVAWGLDELQHWRRSQREVKGDANPATMPSGKNPLRSLSDLSVLRFALSFGLVPFLVYRLQWIPHLQLNPRYRFLEMQRQILGYHESIGNTAADHPYCSPWHSWVWMHRPVGYYFETVEANGETTVFDIHAFGNPVLWWLAALATFALLLLLLRAIADWLRGASLSFGAVWLPSVLVCQYAANWLPWAKVSRCTYIYHYMGASLFAFMALAWWVDRGLASHRRLWHGLSLVAIVAVVLAFGFWLPIYLGLPLSRSAFDARMWFRSWY